MDKSDMIYDLLKEVREEQTEIKLDIHDIQQMDAKQNMILDEHMKRTEIAEKRLDILEDRIKRPIINWDWIKSNILWFITLIGSILAVIAKWKGLF